MKKAIERSFIIKENVLEERKEKYLQTLAITFMIFTWATPVTVRATPWAVSTISHIGLSVITSSESFWTSVTSHQAQAHPPTIVRFFVDPQHPPEIRKRKIGWWVVDILNLKYFVVYYSITLWQNCFIYWSSLNQKRVFNGVLLFFKCWYKNLVWKKVSWYKTWQIILLKIIVRINN